MNPQSDKSRRNVKLTPPALRALTSHRDVLATGDSGCADVDNLVFRTRKGTSLNRHNIGSRSFKPLLKRAGLPRATRFHDLRHTFATLLPLKNVNVKIVSEMLGHSKSSITLNIYSYVLPGMQDVSADALS